MSDPLGPQDLEHFEDRVLYHLVDLAGGNQPRPVDAMVTEAALSERVAHDPAQSVTPELGDPRGILIESLTELERHGYADLHKAMGPWSARPTRNGRERVLGWRRQWQRNRDRRTQRAILTALDDDRRARPNRYTIEGRIDVPALLQDLGIPMEEYLANAQQLRDQGKIAEQSIDQMTLEEGWAHITAGGIAALQRTEGSAPSRGGGDAERAWNEVARLKKRLAMLGQEPSAIIRDAELARRCADLLDADDHYDRVIREACTILENRVRSRPGLSPDSAVPLMQQTFSAKNPRIRLSDHEGEQQGAMEIYTGVMRLFRNGVGHRLVGTITQERALQFVVMVDLLLAMIDDASANAPSAVAGPASHSEAV
jgi:uncharacterized protein (TIGR02391 family)